MKLERKSSQTKKGGLPPLPGKAEEILDAIESGEILGASRSIRLINDVFQLHADHFQGDSGEDLVGEIRAWADYLIETRGALSPAVGNAIRVVLADLEEDVKNEPVSRVQDILRSRTVAFNENSQAKVQKIATVGANLLEEGDRVLTYDYSSTVTAVLRAAAEQSKRLNVVIPESRSLDGGRPILQEVTEMNHTALFITDVAMGHELRACHAVLVGAESLTADGGFWNTVGTCSLAILADYYHIPFYVPTELLKFDVRSLEGRYRDVSRVDISHLFTELESLINNKLVAADIDDLEFTPPELVTCYLTENGLTPPAQIKADALSVLGIDPLNSTAT